MTSDNTPEPGEGLWVRTDPDLDGTYRVSVEAGADRSIFLDRDGAVRYCLAVLAACEHASYDAAVFAQLSARPGLDQRAIVELVADLRMDRPPVDDDATAPLRFVPGVNSKGHPFLAMYLDGAKWGQLHPEPAAQHAMFVLRALAVADLDAAYLRILATSGLDPKVGRAVVGDLSQYREEHEPPEDPSVQPAQANPDPGPPPAGMTEWTSDRLARALVEAGAPAEMAARARQGHYDDYRSPLAMPCVQLVADLTAAGLHDLAERAKGGEFDGTKEESAAWAQSPGGRQAFADLMRTPTSDGSGRPPWRGKRRGKGGGR